MPRIKQTAILALPARVDEKQESQTLKAWALVELFGHNRIVGHVTVDPVDFPGMVRVDVPDLLKDGKVVRPGFTSYFGRGAIYRATPVTEETVRLLLPEVDGHPARPLAFGHEREPDF